MIEEQETPPSAPEMEGQKMQQLETELKEYKDKSLRLLAEMENSRKRMQKEKQEMVRFAAENVIAEFLMPLDNLENALGFADKMSEETRNWAKGFQMILAQFKEVLQQHGVTSIPSEGAAFDPHMHEAVEAEETEQYPEGTILQEYVRGYRVGDRTIRPARVKVAKAPLKKQENQEIKENNTL